MYTPSIALPPLLHLLNLPLLFKYATVRGYEKRTICMKTLIVLFIKNFLVVATEIHLAPANLSTDKFLCHGSEICRRIH